MGADAMKIPSCTRSTGRFAYSGLGLNASSGNPSRIILFAIFFGSISQKNDAVKDASIRIFIEGGKLSPGLFQKKEGKKKGFKRN